MIERPLPESDDQAGRDHEWREGRRRLLAEVRASGVPTYRTNRTALSRKTGPSGRLALVAFFRRRNALFRFLLDGHAYRGNLAFLRFAYSAMPDAEGRLLARWRRKRDRWVVAGSPADLPPWRVIENRSTEVNSK